MKRAARLRHHPARRRPAGGPQPLGRGQAGHRRATSTISGSASSRAAGPAPTPRTPSSSPGPGTELDLRHATLAAFGATRRAGGVGGAGPAGAGAARLRAPPSCASSPSRTPATSSAPCARPREENLEMVRDTVALPRRRGAPGLPRLPSTSSTAGTSTATTPWRCVRTAARGRRRGRRAVRHQRRHAAAQVGDVVADVLAATGRARRASTATTTPAARSPTPSPRCRAGRDATCRAPSTATASAPATPTCSPSSANLQLKLGLQVHASRPPRARPPGSRTRSAR